MKRLIFVFLVLFSVCSGTAQSVYVIVPEAPVAPFPSGINKLVLLDLTKNNKVCLESLKSGLEQDSGRAVSITKTDLPALDWESIVDILHSDTNADLIVLEKTGRYYRTDPSVVYTTQTRYNTGDNPQVVYSSRYAQELYYTYEWKIYDLRTKAILGTYLYEYRDSSRVYAGKAFANRLLPHTITLERKYYATGNKDLRSASFLVRNDLWDKAAGMWERVSKTGWRVARRRAFYNLAIAEEKAGHFSKAIEYARQSQRLGNPDAEFYVLALQNEAKAAELVQTPTH